MYLATTILSWVMGGGLKLNSTPIRKWWVVKSPSNILKKQVILAGVTSPAIQKVPALKNFEQLNASALWESNWIQSPTIPLCIYPGGLNIDKLAHCEHAYYYTVSFNHILWKTQCRNATELEFHINCWKNYILKVTTY